MKQSTSSRRQPLVVMITTAGTVRERVFDEIYCFACEIADGDKKDDTFLPVLYELDSRDEWKIDAIKIGYDRALAGYWVDEMTANGFDMEAVAQGPYTWSQPMREMGHIRQKSRQRYVPGVPIYCPRMIPALRRSIVGRGI